MVIRINHKYISELLHSIKPYFPSTLPIYGALHTINRLQSHTVPIRVDQWPNVGAILISPSSEERNFPTMAHTNMLFAFTADKASDMLKKSKIFEGRKQLFFSQAHRSIWKPIMDHAAWRGFTTEIESQNVDMYYLPNVDKLPARPVLPTGFRLEPLRPEHAAILNSVWFYNMGDITERYFDKIIKMSLAVGIFEKDSETPIAFAVCYEQGEIGNVYVKPGYRQKGFGAVLSFHLLEAICAIGLTPYTSIIPGTPGSSHLAKSVDSIKVEKQFSWIMCTPK